jgi:hypothetical protein
VHGRTTTLSCSAQKGRFPSDVPLTLKVFGRPEFTNHEKAREEFIFLVMMNGPASIALRSNALVSKKVTNAVQAHQH